jgi:hypothetical protein
MIVGLHAKADNIFTTQARKRNPNTRRTARSYQA